MPVGPSWAHACERLFTEEQHVKSWHDAGHHAAADRPAFLRVYDLLKDDGLADMQDTIALLQTGTLPALLANRKAPAGTPVDTPPPGVVT